MAIRRYDTSHPHSPFSLRVASGGVRGVTGVNKFGRNPDIDTASAPEDVWDKGGIWQRPASASVHTIVSSHASDDGNGSGGTYTGAASVKVYGLQTWDVEESSETVQLSGTSEMATVESYVIIHRMEVIASGTSDTNRGNIDAVAQDGSDTSSAMITATYGQTLMAIYGVPSADSFYLDSYYASMDRSAGAAASADIELHVVQNADSATATEQTKHHIGLSVAGTSHSGHIFEPPLCIAGPAVIKLQAENVSANDTDISAGFDGYLVNGTASL